MSEPETPGSLKIHPIVFFASAGIIVGMVIAAAVLGDDMAHFFERVQAAIIERFGWFYVLSMSGFLVFALYIALSRFGDIRLGPDDSTPDYSRASWLSMLFSAGMGIGLLYFAVAEPLLHYAQPATGEGGTLAAAREAMGLTFFHWGLHPWGVYAVVGLTLGYFGFRRGLPLSIRSAFYPLLGERIHGTPGNIIDILAVVSTLFGVATSLGLGAMQVNAGLEHVFGLGQSGTAQVIIIAIITLAATASVVSGLDAGIRRLSEANMVLAVILLVFVLIVGPTAFLAGAFVENLGVYAHQLLLNSFWTATFEPTNRSDWLTSWTVFYWAWWISWAPFVGMFIARISRGRTIREFVLTVLFAPTLFGFIWLTIFGDTALYEQVFGGVNLAGAVEESIPTAVFVLLEQFPLAIASGVLCTLCIILFFVTSSDSASLVIDTIASGGAEHPPVSQRVFWALLEGAVAAALLYVGGLQALQAAAIATALPFCAVIVLMCWSLYKGLRDDPVSPQTGHLLQEAAPEDVLLPSKGADA